MGQGGFDNPTGRAEAAPAQRLGRVRRAFFTPVTQSARPSNGRVCPRAGILGKGREHPGWAGPSPVEKGVAARPGLLTLFPVKNPGHWPTKTPAFRPASAGGKYVAFRRRCAFRWNEKYFVAFKELGGIRGSLLPPAQPVYCRRRVSAKFTRFTPLFKPASRAHSQPANFALTCWCFCANPPVFLGALTSGRRTGYRAARCPTRPAPCCRARAPTAAAPTRPATRAAPTAPTPATCAPATPATAGPRPGRHAQRCRSRRRYPCRRWPLPRRSNPRCGASRWSGSSTTRSSRPSRPVRDRSAAATTTRKKALIEPSGPAGAPGGTSRGHPHPPNRQTAWRAAVVAGCWP